MSSECVYHFGIQNGGRCSKVCTRQDARVCDLDEAMGGLPHVYLFGGLELDRDADIASYRGSDFTGTMFITAEPASVDVCRVRDLVENRRSMRSRRRVMGRTPCGRGINFEIDDESDCSVAGDDPLPFF